MRCVFHLTSQICVLCNGCPESRLENARLEEWLKIKGYDTSSDYTNADYIIFKSCGLTEKSAGYSINIIEDIQNNKKIDAKILVWGCLPKIDLEKMSTVKNGISIYQNEYDMLNDIFNVSNEFDSFEVNCLTPYHEPSNIKTKLLNKIYFYLFKYFSMVNPNKNIFYIRVTNGCNYACTYCAIKNSRGSLKSFEEDIILSQFKLGIEKGYKYFGLLGTDVGSYGKDTGSNIVTLLQKMCAIKGDFKIGLRNFYPNDLVTYFDELKPFFNSKKLWFILTSVQSGSERILYEMGRKYNIEKYKQCIKYLNNNHPEIFLKTQVMVGFPSELSNDYEQSLNFLNEAYFDWVEVYNFSSRPNTVAASMVDQIPENIRRQREYNMIKKTFPQKPIRKIWNYFKFRS